MAHNIIPFTRSTYYRLHHGLDRYLLEKYLFPGLQEQGVLGKGSRGIALPIGENQPSEYITLDEAKQLVISWLVDTDNLLESDKKKLEKIGSYEKFAYTAHDLYQAKIEDPAKLVTATRLQNVAALRAAKQAQVVNQAPHFDPGKIIDQYNAQYLKLLSYSRIGVPNQILNQLINPGVYAGSDVTKNMLSAVIVENLPRLYKAGSIGASSRAQDYSVVKELSNIIRSSHPELNNYLNYLGEENTASHLRNLTNSLVKMGSATNNNFLNEYDSLQTKLAPALDSYLLNETELRQQIISRLTAFNEKERSQIADAILRETVRSSSDPKTFIEIIDQVATKLNLQDAAHQSIKNELSNTGLDVSLEYRENELFLMLNSRRLTRGEVNLIKQGINPFITVDSIATLASKESRLLKEYNSQSLYQNKPFVTLQEAYNNELQQDKPNLTFLNHARSHLNHVTYYQSLTDSEIRLANRTRLGRWVTETQSRFVEMQTNFFDKWIDLEETITGKKWLHKQLDKWDNFAEHFTVKIGKTQIPLFRIVPWIYDRIDEWKKVTTLAWLGKTKNSTSIIGKFVHWNLTQYELGGFTVSGATSVVAYGVWSKGIYWASGKIVKGGTVFATRTATRFLIKVGGKALARAGEKAIAALAAAGTAIGSALGVVFAIGMVFDLLQAGWQFLKRFFTDADFRSSVTKFGLIVGGVILAIPAAIGTFFVGLGMMMLGMLSNIFLAMTIAGGLALFTALSYSGFNMSTHLDSNNSLAQNIAIAVFCKDNDNTPASRAACLAQYLNQCYGNGSITASNVSRGLSCLASYAIAPGAISEIRDSASDNAWLQCVGFVKAVAAWVGTSIGSHNACGYVNDPRFVSGLGGVKQGDAIVFKSSGTCSASAPGHIGILKEDAGANICLIDANYRCSGCVTDGNCLPKTNVAGYLKL